MPIEKEELIEKYTKKIEKAREQVDEWAMIVKALQEQTTLD